MHLYAIARRRGQRLEFYQQLDGGEHVGWTEDWREAWLSPTWREPEARGWAEMVRHELEMQRHHDTFLYVLTLRLGALDELEDTH